MLNYSIVVMQAKRGVVEGQEAAYSPYHLEEAFQKCCNEFNTVAAEYTKESSPEIKLLSTDSTLEGLCQLC